MDGKKSAVSKSTAMNFLLHFFDGGVGFFPSSPASLLGYFFSIGGAASSPFGPPAFSMGYKRWT